MKRIELKGSKGGQLMANVWPVNAGSKYNPEGQVELYTERGRSWIGTMAEFDNFVELVREAKPDDKS